MKQYELGDVNRPQNQQYLGPPEPINSDVAVLYQRIRQTTKNVVDADKSRR